MKGKPEEKKASLKCLTANAVEESFLGCGGKNARRGMEGQESTETRDKDLPVRSSIKAPVQLSLKQKVKLGTGKVGEQDAAAILGSPQAEPQRKAGHSPAFEFRGRERAE